MNKKGNLKIKMNETGLEQTCVIPLPPPPNVNSNLQNNCVCGDFREESRPFGVCSVFDVRAHMHQMFLLLDFENSCIAFKNILLHIRSVCNKV